MAQQVKVLVALVENMGSVAITRVRWSTSVSNSGSRASNATFWPRGHGWHVGGTHAYIQAKNSTHNIRL